MKSSKRKRKSVTESRDSQDPGSPDASAVQSVAAHEPIRTVTSDGTTALAYSMSGSCTMREAAALKADLLSLLEAKQEVVLDVSAVERIDTSALQLLCAFMRDRRSRRLATRWSGAQPAFSEAVEILGLSQALSYTTEARAA